MEKYLLLVISEIPIDIDANIDMLEMFTEFVDSSTIPAAVTDNVAVVVFSSELPKNRIKARLDEFFKDKFCDFYLVKYYADNITYKLDESSNEKFIYDIIDKQEMDILMEIEGILDLSESKPVFSIEDRHKPNVSEATADEILDKIREQGIESLTESEKKILDYRSKQI